MGMGKVGPVVSIRAEAMVMNWVCWEEIGGKRMRRKRFGPAGPRMIGTEEFDRQ